MSAHATAATKMPPEVEALVQSSDRLQAQLLTLQGSSKIKALLQTKYAAILRAVVDACGRRSSATELPLLAASIICVAIETFERCTGLVKTAAAVGVVKRNLIGFDGKAKAYAAAFDALWELLEISEGTAMLIANEATTLKIPTRKPPSDVPHIRGLSVGYEAGRIALQTMVNMSKGTMWPLEALSQTILQLVEHAERTHALSDKFDELFRLIQGRTVTLVSVLRKHGAKEGQSNGEYLLDPVTGQPGVLHEHVVQYLRDLQRVLVHIRVLEAMHPLKAFSTITIVEHFIADETARVNEAQHNLQLALEATTILTVIHTNATVQSIAVAATNTQAALQETTIATKEIRAVVRKTQASIQELTAQRTGVTRNIMLSQMPPPMPAVFYGRDEFVDTAVKHMLKAAPARLALFGPGGIGKTSVALAILHHERVVKTFGDLRFFLSCENIIDADAVAAGIASLLDVDVGKDPLSAIVNHLMSALRTALVIDNFETVWLVDDAMSRSNAQRLLATLSSVPTLALIIPCRGSVLPPDILWSNNENFELAPISLDAAKHSFEEIAKPATTGVERAALDELLVAVDCMPLAVMLLAQLGRKRPPTVLLRRWQTASVDFVKTHDNGRGHNVVASIAFSIELLRQNSASDDPLRLLVICANLPDGLRPTVFEQLRPQFEDIDAARDRLLDHSLASEDQEGALKMLSPVRHFVLKRHAMIQQHTEALHAIYFAIAAACPQKIDEAFKTLAAIVRPEVGNLNSLLMSLVSNPSQDVVDAVCHVAQFGFHTVPSSTLLDATLQHLSPTDHTAWRARCLNILGDILCIYSDSIRAIDVLTEARHLWLRLGRANDAAWCLMIAGHAHQINSQPLMADQVLKMAHEESIAFGDTFNIAECTQFMGYVSSRQGNYVTRSSTSLLRELSSSHWARRLKRYCVPTR